MGVRVHSIFTNFRGGEISPRLFGRIDWDRYASCCVTLENFLIQPQGGVTRRPGSRFVGSAQDARFPVRLIPFIRTSDDVYLLEFGHLYIRVYKYRSWIESAPGVPLSIPSPYAATDLARLHYWQVDDTLVFAHAGYPQYKLVRYSETQWKLVAMTFDPPPSLEYGTRTTNTTGEHLIRGGGTTNVQFDSTQPIFLASDVGREILVTAYGLRATIITVDSTTRVHADIEDDVAFLGAYGVGNWKIDGSPRTTITPNEAGPVGQQIFLTLTDAGWRAEDVGKFVLLSDGVVEITSVTSSVIARGVVHRELDGVTAQPGYAWSLEEAAWSAANEYPATVGWCENRLAFAGNGVWMSASYAPTDFALGSTDDSAILLRPSSGNNDRVRWLSPGRKFLLGTASAEFSITAQGDAALTPKNANPKPSTPHGSGYLMPLRSEHATLFVTANGRLLREMAYAYEVDDYRAPNLLDQAEHLTRTATIVDMAYQHPPESIIWAVRSDGVLLACTYLREQDLVGWHRHVTDGVVESVCTVPSSDGTTDEVWMVVRRTVGGAQVRYIEYLDAAYADQWPTVPGLVTDCAVTYNGVATRTMTNLSHLEGRTVQLVGDGAVFPPAVVTGGQVTLTSACTKIEAGLGFTSTLQTVRPEIPSSGTSQGLPKAWSPIKCRFENTIGGHIQGQIIQTGVPPALFTGDKVVDKLGWSDDAWITVEQRQPLPMTLLAIFGTVAVGD